MRAIHALPGILCLLAASASATESMETRGDIDSVTVYRGQALITRLIELPTPGLREIIVQDLPEQVVPGSLYAESSEGGEVRSVRYRVRPQSQDVREEVRLMDEKIRDAQDRLARVAHQKEVNAKYKSFLDSLEQFMSVSAGSDLGRGLLNAETLKALALFVLEQRRVMAEDDLAASFDHRKTNEELEFLNRERQVLTAGTARTAREAVVFVNITAQSGATVRLRYLVNGASWSPSYTVRATERRDGVTLEYHASIQQMSGEDWNDVSMVLSTATPSLVAKAPAMVPLAVRLTSQDAAHQPFRGRDQLLGEKKELERARNVAGQMLQQQAAASKSAPSDGNEDFDEFDRRLNRLAGEEQLYDIVTQGRFSRKDRAEAPVQDGPTVIYSLPDRTTLPSRSDQQQVQIASMELPGDFYHLAIPVLTNYVYEEAAVRNVSKLVLLAGPATTYLDGQFVGQGDIPSVTTGEEFTVGLGIDSALRATRELLHRNDSIQGGNRMVEFTYAIGLENFGDAPRMVRVLDRLPTGRESEIKVTLISSQIDQYANESTQKSEKKGLLRWDVEVPVGATGEDARNFEYRFKMEYDKGMTVGGLPASDI